MQWLNELTGILEVQYPIIGAPMLGVTTPEMVAAVSEQGGLGTLAIGGLSPEKSSALIQQTKAITQRPFAVNFFAHEIPDIDVVKADRMQDFLEALCARHQLPFARQSATSLRFYTYREQIQVLLDENIPVVSFTFGIPDDDVIAAFHAKGVTLIGTATCVDEARLLDQKGIGIVCAQGIEAGGHRGTFLDDIPLPQMGTMSLVPQIVTQIRRPVIAAGGVYDGHTLRAAMDLGAVGVQIGTAFLASNESAAISAYKAALCDAKDTDAVLTRAFSGRWARGLMNTFMREVEKSGLDIPPYPVQNSLTGQLRTAAQKMDNKEFTNLWAGQSAARAEAIPAAEIFQRIVSETERLQDR